MNPSLAKSARARDRVAKRQAQWCSSRTSAAAESLGVPRDVPGLLVRDESTPSDAASAPASAPAACLSP